MVRLQHVLSGFSEIRALHTQKTFTKSENSSKSWIFNEQCRNNNNFAVHIRVSSEFSTYYPFRFLMGLTPEKSINCTPERPLTA